MRLVEADMIKLERNRGFRVVILGPPNVVDVFQLRLLLLEVPAACRAALAVREAFLSKRADRRISMRPRGPSFRHNRALAAAAIILIRAAKVLLPVLASNAERRIFACSSGVPAGLGHGRRGLCRNVSMGDRPAGVPMIRVKPSADTGMTRMMFLIGVASASVRAARRPGSAPDQVPVPVAEVAGREPGGFRDRAEPFRILKVLAVQPDHVLAGHPVRARLDVHQPDPHPPRLRIAERPEGQRPPCAPPGS